MSKEIREQIDKVKNWKPTLNESMEGGEQLPMSITIKLTDKFKEHMKESSETTSGNKGYANSFTLPELWNNGNRHNLVKVGTIPYDIKRDLQFDFWASYNPKASEIYVSVSNSTNKELEQNSLLDNNTIPSTAPIVSNFKPGYYCKFENGFKVGEVDHRGFFEIVAVN